MSDWIEYLETVDTPTLSNAIELMNVRGRDKGFTPLDVKALFPEFGRMCGYAVTAQVETVTTAESSSRAGFPDLFDAIAAAPKPSVVVLQEVGGFRDYAAHCGQVMATIFNRLGAVGVVSDCAVRDVMEVRALGMHIFARGQVASHANFRIVRSNIPVQVCGMVVRPGDLLHGDENGLITVPDLDRARLHEKIDEIQSRERVLMDYVLGGDCTLEGLREKFLE
ncbi:MAG: RraA family protein [Bryobacteraceae bacterium]